MDSPFEPIGMPDDDIVFAARAIAKWGPHIGEWRRRQGEHMAIVAEAVKPLAEAMRKHMPTTVFQVAGTKNPAMIAVCVVALRWPDRKLPIEYVKGHQLVGHIESSNLFRPIAQDMVTKKKLDEEFLGDSACRFVAGMLARSPPPLANVDCLADMPPTQLLYLSKFPRRRNSQVREAVWCGHLRL